MADRVFLHLGVPKSGTTYLQSALWHHRDALRADGVLLPGDRHADHRYWGFWVREEPPKSETNRRKLADCYARVVTGARDFDGTAVVSHEFTGAATAEQAARAVAAFAPAEVHLVVTARDALSLLTAAWQETVKYASPTPLDDFDTAVSDDPLDVWGWRNLDAAEVLRRWAPAVRPEHVHVVVVPRTRTDEPVLWQRFAGLFTDPTAYDVSAGSRNESMGLVEAELLRRVSEHLDDLPSLMARIAVVRDYVGEQLLVPRAGERFTAGPARVAECRERSAAMVRWIEQAGIDVRGDLADLLVPDELPARRTPEDVTDTELAAAGVELVAAMVKDLNRSRIEQGRAEKARASLRGKVRELEQALEEARSTPTASRLTDRLRGRARRR